MHFIECLAAAGHFVSVRFWWYNGAEKIIESVDSKESEAVGIGGKAIYGRMTIVSAFAASDSWF